MKRVILFAAVVCCATAVVAAQTQPNILFFAVDDMSDWIGPMGYAQAVTPNMDRLARAGVTFLNGHTAGIYCAPSRAAIFSGRFASTTGCYRSALYFAAHPELRPLQQVLQEGGYATYGAGKLFHHVAGQIDMRGWDEFYVRTKAQKETGWPLDSWKHDDAAIIPQPHPRPEIPRLLLTLARSMKMALLCTCEILDSDSPMTSPISLSSRSSK